MSLNGALEHIILSAPCKYRKVIFIDMLFIVIIIIPDKAAILAVLRYRHITDDVSVFMKRIKVKYENSFWEKKIIHKFKCLDNVLILKKVIDAVAHAKHRSAGTIKVKFSHILLKIHDIKSFGRSFFPCNIEHIG